MFSLHLVLAESHSAQHHSDEKQGLSYGYLEQQQILVIAAAAPPVFAREAHTLGAR